MSEITYIFLLPNKDDQHFTNVPPSHLDNGMFQYLSTLPQDMAQITYGIDYYETQKRLNLQLGYKTIFVYPDIANEALLSIPIAEDTPVVYMLSTNNEEDIKKHCENITKIAREKDLCILSEIAYDIWTINCHKACDNETISEWYYSFAKEHYPIDYSREPFCIPSLPRNVYVSGSDFGLTRGNSRLINSALGNFWADISEEEIRTSSYKLVKDNGLDCRQDLIVDQISIIRGLEDSIAKECSAKFKEDEFRAPLILSIPYSSIEMRKLRDIEKQYPQYATLKDYAEKVLGYHYDLDYKFAFVPEAVDEYKIMLARVIMDNIFKPRLSFLDFAGMLHSSFKFSPYLRLPLLSKNINSELSFVGIKNLDKISSSPSKNKSIRKAMETVGKKIAQEALSKRTTEFLKNDASQIVAITDLPIEWTMVDGVPLGFTHDICRLPETPITGLLSQYVEQYYFRYIIPKNILKKTLVIYGNQEEAFVQAQKPVNDLSKKLGFKTRLCLSKKEFFDTIKEEDPDLLIIDSHGDVDPITHKSFLLIGNDIISGDDVVDSHIKPRLVFLSACNTFTTYNTVETIANAFFEAGSLAVTTSYMPLQINPATQLYCRLLNNLEFATTHNIHINWLSFISHLLRTSYIHAPLERVIKKPELDKVIDRDALISLSAESSLFNKRRSIYENLNNNAFTKSLNADYQFIIPHYLMYSTLGRADLVRFEI